MSKKSKRVRRTFSEEFKRDSVNLVVNRTIHSKTVLRRLGWHQEASVNGMRSMHPNLSLVARMHRSNNSLLRSSDCASSFSKPNWSVKS